MEHAASIVLIHGAWDTPDGWRWVRDELARRGLTAVIAIDLPSCRSASASLLDDAAAVAEAAAQLPKPVILVGHSYGAAVASQAGVAADAAHLVLVCGFALPVGESVFDAGQRHAAEAAAKGDTNDTSGPPMVELHEDGTSIVHPDRWTTVLETFPPQVVAALEPRRNQSLMAALTPASSAGWETIPSTFVQAKADRIMHPAAVAEMAARCSDLREHGGTHFITWTHPADVADVIADVARTITA